MRINPGMKPKEPTYKVVLVALTLTTCYPAFLITVEVSVIYMHQEILNICPKVPGKAFDEPPTEEEALSFIHELGHTGEIKYIIDVIVDHLHQPWRTFASIINKCLCEKEDLAYQIDNIDLKKQDKMDDSVLGTMRFVSRHEDTQVYGVILPKVMKNQALLDSIAYKTYYGIASGAEPPKLKKSKGLTALSEVALSEAAQLKEATKRSKKDFHISHASGSGDGTDFESGVPDEQQQKTSSTNEGTGTKPEVPDVPKYDSESDKESWGESVSKTKIKIKTPSLDQTEGRKEGSQAKMLSHPEIQEGPSHTVDVFEVQKNQEFDTGNNDEQPDVEVAPENNWFKKPERPSTPDPDWNKRQHLLNTPIDFSAFVLNRLNIKDLTQEILVEPAFELLKGAEPPKSKKSLKKSDSTILSDESPSKKKCAKAKKPVNKPIQSKNKTPVKADKGKGLNALSEVALSEASQLKEATKRSKKDFHISHASGSGDGTDFESGVPDEQQQKTSSTDEGTGDSGEEDDDDDEDETDDGNDDDDNDMNNDDKTDSERTKLDKINILDLNKSSSEDDENVDERVHTPLDYELINDEKIQDEEKIDDDEKMVEEEDDNVIKELYKDVNVNLGIKDTDMTEVEQGRADQHNVSHGSGFEQEEEDAHVTLTTVHDKTEGTMQSSSVSSDFTSKLLNLENPSLDVNEIASLINTVTTPPPPPFFNPLPQQTTPTPTPTSSEATTSFPTLLDFS
ncbi:hypothetical protein Tco_0611644 [Tanacetum coccineum]